MGFFSTTSGRPQAAGRAQEKIYRENFGPFPGESLDALFKGRIRIAQSLTGYRFSIDSLLLAHFVTVRRAEKIIDLGSGNGVIALALAALHPSASVTGVELQASMNERASRSIRYNQLESRVRMVQGDIRRSAELLQAGGYDVAVCNPPYRRPGTGRISADDERRLARHEFNGALADFLSAAAVMIRNRGRVAFVHLATRTADVLADMRAFRLEPKRLRMVHSQAGAEASLVLVEGVKGGQAGLSVHPPLVLYSALRKYTPEAAMLITGSETAEMGQEPERRRE